MSEKYRSIYQLARNITQLTQFEAAEMLNVSVRSLADYECGVTIPHADIVESMVEVYDTKWLGYEHLRQSTKLGLKCLPPIKVDDLAKSVLILQKETADVDAIKNCMINIACDSKIDDHEKNKWSNITKEIFEMAGAALSVVFSK